MLQLLIKETESNACVYLSSSSSGLVLPFLSSSSLNLKLGDDEEEVKFCDGVEKLKRVSQHVSVLGEMLHIRETVQKVVGWFGALGTQSHNDKGMARTREIFIRTASCTKRYHWQYAHLPVRTVKRQNWKVHRSQMFPYRFQLMKKRC